jgi:hypothetical protein
MVVSKSTSNNIDTMMDDHPHHHHHHSQQQQQTADIGILLQQLMGITEQTLEDVQAP